MSEKKQFTPVQMFAGGLVVGFLLLSTIGFFIMLGVYFNGDKNSVTAGEPDKIVNENSGEAVAQAEPEKNEPQVDVEPFDETVDHARGNENAEVTLIEYSDIECPYCKRFHETSLQLLDEYGDDVRFVFRHFPLDSLHKNARIEANATECAGEQGAFWEMLDAIFDETSSNDGFDLDKLPDLASDLNLDVDQFNECVEEMKYAEKIQDDQDSGVAAGARGTPYSVLLGPEGEVQVLSGAQPYQTVASAIEQLL
ncbi:MAG: thioredoxin domain-containing protein [Candidatus Magasanikbacteria bacterium]|nr:thioredoxin domain-containing protein [Candidatus Magasanikbacteria bacterium]